MKQLTRYECFGNMDTDPQFGEWSAKDEVDARIAEIHAETEAHWAAVGELHAKRIAELEPAAKWFGEVMAIMNGDGGHYVAKHGPEKSALDAVAKYHALLAERDAARAELRYLVEAWECSTLDGGDIDRARRLLDTARGAE